LGIIVSECYDVFLSYARDDNVLHDDAVSIFQSYLKPRMEAEFRLRFRTPREVEVFMDRDGLPANGDLSEELSDAIAKSTFLIIFLGRAYPNSAWCGKELRLFSERFRGKRKEALERTFLIVLDRAAEQAGWGEYLENPERPIFERFYDEATGHLIPLLLEDRDGQAVPSPRFLRRLRHIVETMAERANAIRENQGASGSP
jgi:hypothetical protein